MIKINVQVCTLKARLGGETRKSDVKTCIRAISKAAA